MNSPRATSRFIGSVIIYFVCVAAFIASPVLHGQQLVFPSGSSAESAAVDAQGVRHRGSDYHGNRAPWLDDTIKTVTPDYPYEYRSRHHGGNGLFRTTLNVNTGSVTDVAVLKSTGFSMLDSCAIRALRKWRWKPGRWKEIDVPIAFEVRLPHRR
jgi:TonB family protein